MNNRFPLLSIAIVAFSIGAIAYIVSTKLSREPSDEQAVTTAIETTPIINNEALTDEITREDVEEPSPLPTITPKLEITELPTPSPTPPALDNSDSHIYQSLENLQDGDELSQILTKEEVVRKIVRAVYSLSEGKIVRQYRPLISPEKQLLVNKIGQQTDDTQEEIYRISRENSSRYTRYIAIFSKLNNRLGMELYKFYLPTFEQAYMELGTNEGTFQSTLIKAIDVLLTAPPIDRAILLTRPTVMYKFKDPNLEGLPQAHKLMLRMGQENSEALKLELKKLRERLLEMNAY